MIEMQATAKLGPVQLNKNQNNIWPKQKWSGSQYKVTGSVMVAQRLGYGM